jgi:hypothetical protein
VSTSVNADRITNETTIGAAIMRMDDDPADGGAVGAAWAAFPAAGVGEPCGGPDAADRSFKEGRF